MKTRENEDDRVQRLLTLLEPSAEPAASDHVDDETLALLTGGTASARELEAVRADLVVCPPCRRLVGQVLRDVGPRHTEALPSRPWRWLRRATAIRVCAAAACLLLGATVVYWSSNRGGALAPGPRAGSAHETVGAELLAASVRWERSGSRGAATEAPAITLEIDSPRDGVAVVLVVADGRWELLRGERPVKQGPGNDYGPIEPPPVPVVYIIVLTDRRERGELSRLIRESLPGEPRDIEAHYEAWRDDICRRLSRDGHNWVSIEVLRVEATKPGPADRPPSSSPPGRPSF